MAEATQYCPDRALVLRAMAISLTFVGVGALLSPLTKGQPALNYASAAYTSTRVSGGRGPRLVGIKRHPAVGWQAQRTFGGSILRSATWLLPLARLLTWSPAARRARSGSRVVCYDSAAQAQPCIGDFCLPPRLAASIQALRSLPSDHLRYQQLLALGAKLPPMCQELKTRENKVVGCLSTVHVHANLLHDGTIAFDGDSDALISKGLVALLVDGLFGCTAEEIARVDPEFIKASGIVTSLSRGRNNGFRNMLNLMKQKAVSLNSGAGRAACMGQDSIKPIC